MLAGQIALLMAGLFTGAAFYINFAEHPARMQLPAKVAVEQWAPSYKRGFAMQATLVIIGGLAALAQWYWHGGTLWLIGGVVLLANWPYTLIAIMPTNRRLLASDALPETDVSTLLRQWNRLHGWRTILGLISTMTLLTASLG